MDTILVADKVTKRYGKQTALNAVSLHIPKNTIYGLLGPNGAGKTSLIRIINQITYPDSGQVYLNGEILQPKHIAKIGYLPEERGLYKSMRVGEQVLYLAQLKGMSKAEAKKRLIYWFDKFDIAPWWNKKVQELSKGMAQKIQFIVTVLHEPELLIFDEPFSGFDPINASLIKDEILALKAKGSSIIFSTHRMESVEELCDHIALIHRSEKLLDGKLAEIKDSFKSHHFKVNLTHITSAESVRSIANSYGVAELFFSENAQQVSFEVHLPNGVSGSFLSQVGVLANISLFQEVIPSANDIFIQTVKNREVNG